MTPKLVLQTFFWYCQDFASASSAAFQPAADLVPEVLPRDTQGRLRSYEPQGRTAPRDVIGSFITF
jgi:hypothetical protein